MPLSIDTVLTRKSPSTNWPEPVKESSLNEPDVTRTVAFPAVYVTSPADPVTSPADPAASPADPAASPAEPTVVATVYSYGGAAAPPPLALPNTAAAAGFSVAGAS